MAGEFSLGTPVLSRPGATSEAYGCSNQVGLVLESRRKHSRVFFPFNARVYWVPNGELSRVKADALEDRPLERRLVWLIARLGGTEANVERFSPQGVVVEIHHGAVTDEQFDAMRREMGDACVRWTLNPGGQSKIASVIEYR